MKEICRLPFFNSFLIKLIVLIMQLIIIIIIGLVVLIKLRQSGQSMRTSANDCGIKLV